VKQLHFRKLSVPEPAAPATKADAAM
jgi:hypothetical protein